MIKLDLDILSMRKSIALLRKSCQLLSIAAKGGDKEDVQLVKAKSTQPYGFPHSLLVVQKKQLSPF